MGDFVPAAILLNRKHCMVTKIVECIPNFSEGRRIDVVDRIVDAIMSVTGIGLLDRSSDYDHNRSVVTFAGSPDAVMEAAFRSIKEAAQYINMETHKGVHPRIGATDVVPLVPIQGISLKECAQMAMHLGKRVGHELAIPVYLYEAAAVSPDRVQLESIRRPKYEGLKEVIVSDPYFKPDYGPLSLGTAGATVIGARNALIAFNVYLTTSDVRLAKTIARNIRQSSGGLEAVKAIGVLVGGRAQVSMNLTDYTRTGLAKVMETLQREAAFLGVEIHHSEFIGLVPQTALLELARWYLKIATLSPDHILETRLHSELGVYKSQ